MVKIAIIGAGISGLSLAQLLKQLPTNIDITLFEKARGVSGRMSTRRAEPYFFDHGAQYFTARTQPFRQFIAPLIQQGVIQRWNARYVQFVGTKQTIQADWLNDEPRYVGIPGMNHVAKQLSNGLNIHLNTRIIKLTKNATWQLQDTNGHNHTGFDWVICTAPSPQAAALLPTHFQHYKAIQDIAMQPCLSLMLGFDKPLILPFDAAHVTQSDISWLAINSHKPERSEPFTLVVHSSAAYAASNIDKNKASVIQHLCRQASTLVGHDVSQAIYQTLHGWRYASNDGRDANTPVFIDASIGLGACGDWCLGGRVEGAFTAAYNMAGALNKQLLK